MLVREVKPNEKGRSTIIIIHPNKTEHRPSPNIYPIQNVE